MVRGDQRGETADEGDETTGGARRRVKEGGTADACSSSHVGDGRRPPAGAAFSGVRRGQGKAEARLLLPSLHPLLLTLFVFFYLHTVCRR